MANLEKELLERDWEGDEDGLRGVLHAAHAAASAPGSATVKPYDAKAFCAAGFLQQLQEYFVFVDQEHSSQRSV